MAFLQEKKTITVQISHSLLCGIVNVRVSLALCWDILHCTWDEAKDELEK